ncbi:hypothetical protein BDV38DRAFT_196245 [Aspergillus pseudotamarii]|uniref:Microbial-type PARG catalytic domain-containing protein n=1 Tax=Aspergillus pseudotamarii TaxID=132259 RepID=A0A5N6SEE0_ASPPS|nr:uncharacterized protein BDV38DRAFT_196245 [Aspergillus pseudotamarii]KAE8132985.1 hypothetical protein BDV38DRAFT_196245 [Aspergillus pseudotamarii]
MSSSEPPMTSTGSNRRAILSSTAKETKELLPQILAVLPHAPPTGIRCSRDTLPVLDSKYSPNLNTQVEVVNGDAFNIAISLTRPTDTRSACVLNLASDKSAGGGWLRGALAQEEELCYRSSLSFTLKLRYYPLRNHDAIYSPTVVVFRENFTDGHRLMDLQKPESLPIVSVVSMAALRRPDVDRNTQPPRYKHIADRALMKDKMRVILRAAAYNKHRKLVLGAFGCGAFDNPKEEVANCWAEVLQEPEFQGWWENIVFAVLENTGNLAKSKGNFNVFHSRLHGLRV